MKRIDTESGATKKTRISGAIQRMRVGVGGGSRKYQRPNATPERPDARNVTTQRMPKLRWNCSSASLPPQSHLAVPEKAATDAFYFAVAFEGAGKISPPQC
jgi:hypothetical protein